MNNIIKRTWNQNSMVIIEDLRGLAFQEEANGHTFEISGLDQSGQAVALSGTPSGVMLRSDNQDVALTCSVSDGKVYATLPANAYAVPGRFGLTIFLTSDSQTMAIYAAVGTVKKTSSGTVAPPAGADVVTLVNAIAAAVATIPASYTDMMAAMAPTYSNTALYGVGQYAWYDGVLKRCIVPITTAESYTAAHWTNANLGGDVTDLKSAISDDDGELIQSSNLEKAIYGGDYDIVYDKSFLTNSGSVIAKSNGALMGNNQAWKYSDYIFIRPSDTQRVIYITDEMGATNSWGMAFYDSKKNFISGSGISYNNYAHQAFDIPENASYIRFSSNNIAKVTTVEIVESVERKNSDVGILVKELAQPLNKLSVYFSKTHVYPYVEFWVDVDGKPFTLTKQVNMNTETSRMVGFIPVIPGAKYHITFDGSQQAYNNRIRIMVGVIDGMTARYLVENDSIPVADRQAPIEERLGGPWGIKFSNAVFSEDYSVGTLDIEIPSTIDGSDGLYLCWPQKAYMISTDLNMVVTEIQDFSFPNSETGLSSPHLLGGVVNLARMDRSVVVYGLGDSTNSDDKTRIATDTDNLHFSPTKVIAQRLQACKYVNNSVPGTTIASMYSASQTIENDATIVVIITGINDLDRQTKPIGDIDEILAIEDPDDIPETTLLGIYTKAVRKLRARLAKNAQIVCVSPLFFSSTTIRSDLIQFREGLRKMCYTLKSTKGFKFVDGCDVGLNPQNKCMLCRDNTHPLMEGQVVVASHILEHIAPPSIAAEQYDLDTTIPAYTPLVSD